MKCRPPSVCHRFFFVTFKRHLLKKGATRHVAHLFLGMQMIYEISNLHDISIHEAQKAGLKFQCPSCWNPRDLGSGPLGSWFRPTGSNRGKFQAELDQLAACIGILDLTEDRRIDNENIDSNHNFNLWIANSDGFLSFLSFLLSFFDFTNGCSHFQGLQESTNYKM